MQGQGEAVMFLRQGYSGRLRLAWVVVVGALATSSLLVLDNAASGQKKIDVLHIGTSGSVSGEMGKKGDAALETLKAFIKDETGFQNDIVNEKNWQELTEKLAKGQLHIGVYQGHEYAWAQEKHGELQPLALAINVYHYPVAYVITQKDNPAKDFAGLQGQSLALSGNNPPYLSFYLEREAKGKKLDKFFSKITAPETVEDAIDDVVDGVVQVAVVDRTGLEGFKRRKPGRFAKLKAVVHSEPFPPTVIAYYDKVVDDATLARFKDGIVGASKKEKGQMMLTLFRLSGFEDAQPDFAKVLSATRKMYPPEGGKAP